jgi:hypothetical protein
MELLFPAALEACRLLADVWEAAANVKLASGSGAGFSA